VTTPITMWRTCWNTIIEQVECAKVTDKSVWLLTNRWRNDGSRLEKPFREARKTANHSYHDTWEEAHLYLLARVERDLESARLRLQRIQGYYGTIKGMKKPESTKHSAPSSEGD
jgi:hypothetical protein